MANKILASFELMRMKNILLASIATPVGALLALGDFSSITEYPEVIFATTSVLFFMGAGNTMNDLRDVDIDRIAHPNRPLAREALSEKEAKTLMISLALLSLGSLVACCLMMEDERKYTLSIYSIVALLMLSYDSLLELKNKGLAGNISISLLVAAVTLYGASSVGEVTNPLIWYVSGVVFFVNLAREIVKDCQDLDADSESRVTLPMKIGLENSRMVAYVMTLFGLVMLYIPYWQGPFEFGQLLFQAPAMLVLITLNGPMWKGDDYVAATRLRIAMLLGLLGFILTLVV
ncbi:MAG: UbiA family prenyltransferase [Candidatus Poseidoniaceae archaeon]